MSYAIADYPDLLEYQFSSDNSTLKNYQLYEMITYGGSPVSVDDMKVYLSIPAANTSHDALLTTLLLTCALWGQKYTGREFSINVYTLLIDALESRISVRRNPIDTIDSIKYSVDAQFDTTIDSSVYYPKHGVQLSEILEDPDEDWPTDGWDKEQGIEITFTTKAIGEDKLPIAETAIKVCVAYMFSNRGDCGDCSECASKSGAQKLFDMIRIPQI